VKIVTSAMERPAGYLPCVRIVSERCFRILLLLLCMCALFTGPGFSAQVTLAWDRNPEQDIAGYRIYYGTASRLYNWFVDVGNVATYTVTGLPDDGGTYFFAATAYDTSQVESTYSIEAVWYQSFVEPMLNEITIGTQLTISGSNLGAKKGKVFVGSAPAKILSWDNTSIICVVNKIPLYSGPYDAIIKLQPYKSTSPIIFPGVLTVMNPELDPFSTGHGSPGDQIATTGRFFGTKKGKVYLEDPSTGKKKNCKVSSWSMDPGTGESTLTFIVPKGLAAGRYPLKVTNKVGTIETTFTIDP
jgi:hypothetical protein